MKKIINTYEKINGVNGWDTWPPTAPEAYRKPKVLLIEDSDLYIITCKHLSKKYNIDLSVCKSLEWVVKMNLYSAETQYHYSKFDWILVNGFTHDRIDGVQMIESVPKKYRQKMIPFSMDEDVNEEMIKLGSQSIFVGKDNITNIFKYIGDIYQIKKKGEIR